MLKLQIQTNYLIKKVIKLTLKFENLLLSLIFVKIMKNYEN